jgi:hypothetical protein
MCMVQVNQINPRQFYTCYEIARLGLIPHIKNQWQMVRLAKADKLTNNWLDAVRTLRGEKGVQWVIKGSNIIKYLANLDDLKK